MLQSGRTVKPEPDRLRVMTACRASSRPMRGISEARCALPRAFLRLGGDLCRGCYSDSKGEP